MLVNINIKTIKNKISAVLALILGIMTVLVGSRVLLGFSQPNYYVLNWLVIYNVILGIISITVSILIWQRSKLSLRAALLITASHVTVLISLLAIFNTTVATESIKAMIFRIIMWSLISLLLVKRPEEKKNFI